MGQHSRNHGWFWNPGEDHKVYPLEALMDMYYRSVGYNANLLLNANPNPDGLVPEADVRRYQEFGKEIQRRFGKPVAETSGQGTEVVLQRVQPSDLQEVHGAHVPEGHLTVAHRFNGGKTRPLFRSQSRRDD